MKTRWMLAILLITAISLTACSKKEEPAPKAPTEKEITSMTDSLKEKATTAMNEALTMDIDLDKAVSDLKAEAAKMSVEDLQAIATKYKNAIMEKQVDIDAITEKLKAIPMTEKMGADAQKLTGELKTLGDALKPLAERFEVYVDAIKAKGGDISALAL